VDEAVRDVTVGDVLKLTKGLITVDESLDSNEGLMNIY